MSDHLDAEDLPGLQRVVVGLHLTFCPMCKRYLHSLEATKRALGALGDLTEHGHDKKTD
jgi:hypothetical protein